MKNKIDQLNKRVNRPLSPGEVVAGILEEQEITQTQAADHLGISRTSPGELINNRRALTPDIAARLERYFGNGIGVWLRMQQTVDLWDAVRMDQSKYETIEPLQQVA
ncbi:MAG: HigA family addiction module antitoxin [Abditibacteriaceae bacterium]